MHTYLSLFNARVIFIGNSNKNECYGVSQLEYQLNSNKSLYTIGETAELTGLSPRILHLHEERGLIKTVRKSKNGNRYFDKQNIYRLEKIKQLQLIGLSLDEIAEVIDLYFKANDYGASGKRAALEILHKQLTDIEKKEQEINTLKEDIIRSIAKLEVLLQQSEQQQNSHQP